MYILKNALRSISRSKGRNLLIGVIVFVIALSSCVSLSIRQASETAKENALSQLKITAQISQDREALMQGMEDRESRKEALSGINGLSLEELEIYAEAESVSDFYYTLSASLNGSSLEPVDTTGISDEETDADSSEETMENRMSDAEAPGGIAENNANGGVSENRDSGFGGGRMGVQGDFTVTGYSSDRAMTDFLNGTSSITEGEMFAEGTADNTCVINSELASYNDISVGDTITLENPNKEEETYELTVCGIYEKESSADSFSNMMGGFSTAADSSNQIYMSDQTLEQILEASESSAETTEDETTGQETTTAIQSTLNGTYAFDTADDYEQFQEEVKELGLPDGYTVSSSDLTAYEESLTPLENLSEYAGYFLLLILLIGMVILIVLNIFSIRERKYEIGVLAAIGMKKWKIAVQFMAELLCVTFCALIIGAGIGAALSVPVTNKLLEKQIESSAASFEGQEERFGREMGDMPGNPQDNSSQDNSSQDNSSQEAGEEAPSESTQTERTNGTQDVIGAGPAGMAASYINEVSSAANLTVIVQMIGIGLLLTVISGLTALIFILRYDPLRILSNRD